MNNTRQVLILRDTGAPHFDCKMVVETYMRQELGLPTTAVRPGPFMELMNDKAFFPPLPVAIFNKMAGPEMAVMWHWLTDYLAANDSGMLKADVAAAREVCPDLHGVADWLKRSRNGHGV